MLKNNLYTIDKISKPQKFKSRSTAELKKIAHDIYIGRVFCNRQVEPSMFGTVFMVWALLDPMEKKEMIDKGMSMVYASMEDTAPRSINGYPIFWSMSVLNRQDDRRVYMYYRQIQEKMGEYKGDFIYEE
jgi:hypothetical protein